MIFGEDGYPKNHVVYSYVLNASEGQMTFHRDYLQGTKQTQRFENDKKQWVKIESDLTQRPNIIKVTASDMDATAIEALKKALGIK